MARDMYTIITNPNGEIVFDSADDCGDYFVGRNDETNAMYRFCEPFTTIEKGVKQELFGINLTSLKQRSAVKKELEELQDSRDRQYDTIQAELDDLRAARRHAPSVEVFFDFTEHYDEIRRDCDDVYWNRATDMERLIDRTVNKAIQLANVGFVRTDDPDFAGYQIYFVFSD